MRTYKAAISCLSCKIFENSKDCKQLLLYLRYNDVHFSSQLPQRWHQLFGISVDTNPTAIHEDLRGTVNVTAKLIYLIKCSINRKTWSFICHPFFSMWLLFQSWFHLFFTCILLSVKIISIILSRVNHKVGRKQEILEKKNLSTRKQNLDRLFQFATVWLCRFLIVACLFTWLVSNVTRARLEPTVKRWRVI